MAVIAFGYESQYDNETSNIHAKFLMFIETSHQDTMNLNLIIGIKTIQAIIMPSQKIAG